MDKIKRTYNMLSSNLEKVENLRSMLFELYGINFTQADVINYAVSKLNDDLKDGDKKL